MWWGLICSASGRRQAPDATGLGILPSASVDSDHFTARDSRPVDQSPVRFAASANRTVWPLELGPKEAQRHAGVRRVRPLSQVYRGPFGSPPSPALGSFSPLSPWRGGLEPVFLPRALSPRRMRLHQSPPPPVSTHSTLLPSIGVAAAQ